METNIPDYDVEPDRKSRTNWFLIAVIIMLCIVTFVQGVMLFGIKTERHGRPLEQVWRERLQKVLPGPADQSDQTAFKPPDKQVVFWETTDDLAQIHDQINRLLRNMNSTIGAGMSGGPFPGVAIQRASGTHPQNTPPPIRDVRRLQREIEQIFEDAYNESQRNTLLSRFNRGWDMVPSAAAMNIEDQGSNYVVTVALPGFDKQGITIRLEGHLLIIDAAQPLRAPAASDRNATIMRRGRFHTQIMMPDDIKGGGAQADYNNDVLCVHIPKTAETNSLVRSITIR